MTRVGRAGVTLVETLVVILILGILLAVLMPAVQYTREASRRSQCFSNLHQIGIALQTHHDVRGHLPPSVEWSPAGEPIGNGIAPPGTVDHVSHGLASKTEPDRLFANWVIRLLPYLEQQSLGEMFDLKLPIDAERNERARATEVVTMKCPSDPWNGPENHFQRAGDFSRDRGYARGNYAMNFGTNARCLMRLSKMPRRSGCPDGFQANGTSLETDTSQVWGSGIGGVNKTVRFKEFKNGLSKTVAIDEIRAGSNAFDRRGVWALGFAGSSVTSAHGKDGNGGPNQGEDRIQGCSQATAKGPSPASEGMPCRTRGNPEFEICEQATARSAHSGGVNLLMADGSVHFVGDSIDHDTWDRMHRRDNQMELDLPF